MARQKPAPKSLKRRARGTGAFFKSDALGCWIGRVKAGKRPDGSTLYIERRARTSEALQAKLAAVRPPGPDTTVAEWCERWHKEIGVGPSTRDGYRGGLDNHIIPTLGQIRMVDLTAGHIEYAARQWANAGLGNGTVRKLLSQVRNCLEGARRAKLIHENPARDARKPRPPKPKINPFTPAELARIIEEAGRWPECRLFALLASTGCRIGEALALDVSDYRDGTVSITRTYSPEHGLRRTKSENGVRTIRVPPQALSAVQPRTKSGPLFPGQRGSRRRNCATWHSWARLLARLGLKYRNMHQLRHSYCAHLLAAGAPIADLARAVGDSPVTIMRTYAHPTSFDVTGAFERILGSVECTKGVLATRASGLGA